MFWRRCLGSAKGAQARRETRKGARYCLRGVLGAALVWRGFLYGLIVITATASSLMAQDASKYQAILDRLDALEKQNAALLEEIHSLQQDIRAERDQQKSEAEQSKEISDTASRRIAEHEQTKVGASQRYPVSLTGMLLFDAGYTSGDNDDPQFRSRFPDYGGSAPGGGASLRQSVIGLEFHGPEAFGAKVEGSLSMDFYSANGDDNVFRIRRGNISFDWTTQQLLFGQEKPLIAPYQPTSYAHVGVPPLAGAGNLWLWTPQVRYLKHLAPTPSTHVTLAGALLATAENYGGALVPSNVTYSPIRPAGEARIELSHDWNDARLFALGFGAHASESHIAGTSVPSRVLSADLKFTPARWFELTGTLLHGSNFANLGGLPDGATIRGLSVTAIRGSAGWLQLAFPLTSRLTFDIYGGRQSNISRDLTAYQLAGGNMYAGNILYRAAPNVVLGFEAGSQYLRYLTPIRIDNMRYDATLAYLF